MQEKCIYKMVLSIIYSIIMSGLLALIVVFQVLRGNILLVSLGSISFFFIIVYFILMSIYYGLNKGNSKICIERIATCFKVLFWVLLIIYFILCFSNIGKWILFGISVLLGILLIVFKSINILPRFRVIINSLLLGIYTFALCFSIDNSFLLFLGLGAGVLFYLFDLFDKFIFSIFPLMLLGIFLIFL